MATRLNLLIDQGADFTLSRVINGSDGLPMDFTGVQGRAEFRQHFSSVRSYPITVSLASGNTGVLTLTIPSTVTTNARYGRYVYDVELTANNGTVTRVLEGILTLNPEVTRLRAPAAPEPLPSIEFQFFGPDNTFFGSVGLPTVMNATVAVTPIDTVVTAKWQQFVVDQWVDIVSGEGGFTFSSIGNDYSLEFTPPDESGATVRLFAESGIAVAASSSAQFFYSPA